MVEEYEEFRDALRQIAVHDPDLKLVAAAERCLDDMSPANQYAVFAMAGGSIYRARLSALYAAIIVMEAA